MKTETAPCISNPQDYYNGLLTLPSCEVAITAPKVPSLLHADDRYLPITNSYGLSNNSGDILRLCSLLNSPANTVNSCVD